MYIIVSIDSLHAIVRLSVRQNRKMFFFLRWLFGQPLLYTVLKERKAQWRAVLQCSQIQNWELFLKSITQRTISLRSRSSQSVNTRRRCCCWCTSLPWSTLVAIVDSLAFYLTISEAIFINLHHDAASQHTYIYKMTQSTLKRRQLIAASCTTIAVALVASTLLLSTTLQKFSFDSTTAGNDKSLQRWIDLQRPSRSLSNNDTITNDSLDHNIHLFDIGNESFISIDDIAKLSYDSSCLSEEGHHVLGSRYLEERRSAVDYTTAGDNSEVEEVTHRRRLDHDSVEDGAKIIKERSDDDPSVDLQYLRGGIVSSEYYSNDDESEQINSDEQEGRIDKTVRMSPKKMLLRTANSATITNHNNDNQLQSNNIEDEVINHRNLINNNNYPTYNYHNEQEAWSTHTGSEVAPPPPSPDTDADLLQQYIMDFLSDMNQGEENIQYMDTTTTTEETETEIENERDEELYQRLEEVMKVTESLHVQFGGSPLDASGNNDGEDTMMQYSHSSQHSRQRMLTGSCELCLY